MGGIPIVIVAAMARNGVIGDGASLPWDIPSDLARFRGMTINKPVIMGRRTFEGLPRPLPFRDVIIVTRDPSWEPAKPLNRHYVARSLLAAVAMAAVSSATSLAGEIMVAGGADIYRQALPLADRIELTLVDAEPRGSHVFPSYARDDWKVEWRTGPYRNAGDDHAYETVSMTRNRCRPAVAAE